MVVVLSIFGRGFSGQLDYYNTPTGKKSPTSTLFKNINRGNVSNRILWLQNIIEKSLKSFSEKLILIHVHFVESEVVVDTFRDLPYPYSYLLYPYHY